MKKIIGCTAGEWALKLYTVDRFISLEYLLDEQEGEYGICGVSKRVHSYEYLRNEKIDDLIVIINDTRKYEEIKKKLEKYGLIENIHFFNGWKLDSKLNSHPSFPFCKRVSHFESDLQILYPTFHFCNDFPVFFLAFMI